MVFGFGFACVSVIWVRWVVLVVLPAGFGFLWGWYNTVSGGFLWLVLCLVLVVVSRFVTWW